MHVKRVLEGEMRKSGGFFLLAAVLLSAVAASAGEPVVRFPTGLLVEIDDGDPVYGLCEWRSFRLHGTSVGDVDAVFEKMRFAELSDDRKTVKVIFKNGDVLHGTHDLVEFNLRTGIGTVSIPIGHVVRIKPQEAFEPVYNPENGHWYALVDKALTWEWARRRTKNLVWRDMPGHLATLTSPAESDWVRANLKAGRTGESWWLGGYQFGGSEPDGGWRWVTGEAWSWTNWHSGEPNDADYNHQDHLIFYSHTEGHWDDYPGILELPFLVEFEPTSPEAATDAAVGRRTPEEAFGPVHNPENGHWYALVDEAVTWERARCRANTLVWRDMPGHLATLTTPAENDWVRANLKAGKTGEWWLGGYQFGGGEPDGGWRWVTGEAWSWTNWNAGEPNDAGKGHQDYLRFYSRLEGYWDDYQGTRELPFLVEFEPTSPEAASEPEGSE